MTAMVPSYVLMRSSFRVMTVCLFAGSLLAACGSKEADSTEQSAGVTNATPGGDSKAERPRRDKDKDKGEATMTLGANPWQADRVKASLQDATLTIRASQTEVKGKTVTRQELHLQVRDFKGPGDYETGVTGSRFIGVGIDGEAAAKSEDSAAEAATAALADTKHLMLSQAKVTIAAASETEVSGTFSWQPPAGMEKPAITNGTFRAPISK